MSLLLTSPRYLETLEDAQNIYVNMFPFSKLEISTPIGQLVLTNYDTNMANSLITFGIFDKSRNDNPK